MSIKVVDMSKEIEGVQILNIFKIPKIKLSIFKKSDFLVLLLDKKGEISLKTLHI